MNFNGRSIFFVALGCGLTLFPPHSIHAQQPADQSVAGPTGLRRRIRKPIL